MREGVLCEALRELRLRGWGRCPGCLLEVATLEGETVLKGLHLTDEKLTLWRLKHVAMERSAPAKVTLCRLGWFSSAVSRSHPLDARSMRGLRSRGAAPASVRVAHPSRETRSRAVQAAREIAAAFVIREQWWKVTLWRVGQAHLWKSTLRGSRHSPSASATPSVTFERAFSGKTTETKKALVRLSTSAAAPSGPLSMGGGARSNPVRATRRGV
jgi:hypothetical protein